MSSRIFLANGMAHGDETKGATVDFLSRIFEDTHTVVRGNGGAQAVHHVKTPDGRLHAFHQFGSGSFVRQIRTHHSRFMLVSPPHLVTEARDLASLGVANPLSRLTIDEQAPIITPWHRAANWLRTIAMGDGRHGTTGMGIAEVMQDVLAAAPDMLYAGDLRNAQLTAKKVYQIRRRKQTELFELIKSLPEPLSEQALTAIEALNDQETITNFLQVCHVLRQQVQIVSGDYLGTILNQDGTVIFEGAQGVLLDEWYGFHPHTTWSTTTFQNSFTLLGEQGYQGKVTRLGIFRAYGTRHGEGPFVTEDKDLGKLLPEIDNHANSWPGAFRVGWFDLVTARYALAVTGGADALSINCLDRIAELPEVKLATAYRYHGSATAEELHRFFEFESGDGSPRITAIKVDHSRNLDRQAELTSHLFQCQPEYVSMPPAQFLPFLSSELSAPIAVTGYGPTANDRRVVLPEIFSKVC